jgi:hypothetical protein
VRYVRHEAKEAYRSSQEQRFSCQSCEIFRLQTNKYRCGVSARQQTFRFTGSLRHKLTTVLMFFNGCGDAMSDVIVCRRQDVCIRNMTQRTALVGLWQSHYSIDANQEAKLLDDLARASGLNGRPALTRVLKMLISGLDVAGNIDGYNDALTPAVH